MCECGAYCDGYQWQCAACSPIIVDVAGNGFSLTSSSGGVWFDLSGMGTKKKMSWTAAGSDDGFLAFDRDGNGVIDSGIELFGNFTPQPRSRMPNGFLALAMLDNTESGGNGDGVIDALDAAFPDLRIWVDGNHDGLSDPGELFSLTQVDIHSFALRYQTHRFADDHGNEFRYRARVRGSRHSDVGKWAYDVFLVPAGVAASQRGGANQALRSAEQIPIAGPAPSPVARGCRETVRALPPRR